MYHPRLWNPALTDDASEEVKEYFPLDAEDSDDDYNYGIPSNRDLQGKLEPRWPADAEQTVEVSKADQCETPGASEMQMRVIDASASERVASGTAASTAADSRNLLGPSEVRQQRECDTYSNDSDCDDSEYPVKYLVEIFKGDEELGIPQTEEQDYTLFVADSGEPADSEEFLWHDMTEFAACSEAFTQSNGPTRSLPDPYTAFTAIWDESIMEEICLETNRYFKQEMEKEVRSECSRTKFWKNTNVHEMYTFLAIVLLMGIIQMPSIECYFSLDELLYHPDFGRIMSKHRYRLLSAFLHFVNNEDLPTYQGNKKLFKMQSIIDHCNRKFKELYIPSKNIAIDESLTLWKGKLSWRQYIASKSAKFGIKTFELCESATGYLWSFTVYTGKDSASTLSTIVPKGVNKSTEIVLTLIEPLLNKGYTVWMDNWFISPLLARFLKNRKTDCAGTLRANLKDVPKELKNHEVEKGKIFGLASAFCAVFAWLDKRRVSLISTFHTNEMVEVRSKGRPVVTKPKIVQDYNSFMGGIDKKDQMLSAYLVERKRSRKWYVKFFKRLLNVSILNARILYETSTKNKIPHLQFRLSLIRLLLEHHLKQARSQFRPVPPLIPRQRKRSGDLDINLTNPVDAHELVDVAPRKECVVCKRQGKRKQIHYKCNKCDVLLCVTPCFNMFHRDPDFKNYFSASTTRRRRL